MKTISLSIDFSRNPAGRFRTDGPNSGERFREDLLTPALRNNDSVVIELDGVRGFGSSFLEEAFGGLVRKDGFGHLELKSKLKINSPIRTYEARIWKYISDAAPGK